MIRCHLLPSALICGWFAALACLVASIAPAPQALARPENFTGPFEVRDALHFHIVNNAGEPFSLTLRWRDLRQAEMDRPLLVRVFDPDENLLIRHDLPGEKTADGSIPQHEIKLNVPARGPGVYQVIVNAFFGGALEISTEPKLPWGIYAAPELTGIQNQFAQSYIFLPPGLKSLPVRYQGEVESLELSDASGVIQLALRGQNQAGQIALPDNGAHVWTLTVRSKGRYHLNFSGLPIVLCPDAQTARVVAASVDVLDDGTICFHKFQKRAHEILKRYRAMPPSAFAVRVPEFRADRRLWLAEPDRNQFLVGPSGVFSLLESVLREQNLDSSSAWFGSIYVWRKVPRRSEPGVWGAGGPARRAGAPDHPLARYDRAGLKYLAEFVSVLGAVYSVNEPFNPLRRDEALRNRIIIACLQELMMLREFELPEPIPTLGAGDRAFAFGRIVQTFPWVIRDCPEDVRDVMIEGIRRYADRMSCTQIGGIVNQWAFIIRGLQHAADATGEACYAELVQRHLHWVLTRNQWGRGWQPAGYFDENEGPDATYIGISMHELGQLYEMTRDGKLLEALRRCIDLFNHTIAPEPAARHSRVRGNDERERWLGASNFAHRTPGDWTTPQSGAGIMMLADDLREAAAHLGRAWLSVTPPKDGAEFRAREESLARQLQSYGADAFTNPGGGPGRIGGAAELHFAIWKHFADHPLRGQLPMAEQQRFTRAFADEFFAVRRPLYYALIYAGKSMSDWQKVRRPADPRIQHPRNGGGLCMFWSPMFGSSILGKNWSAYAAHTIIAEKSGDEKDSHADWEDYWSVHSAFDETNATAEVTGKLRDQPLSFRKRYVFHENGVECALTLSADETIDSLTLDALWECFPFPLDKPQEIRVRLLDAQLKPASTGPMSAIEFRTNSPEVHLIVFDQPRRSDIGIDTGTDVAQKKQRHGRVLTSLPSQWQGGQSRTFKWFMTACPVGRVEAVVREAQALLARP